MLAASHSDHDLDSVETSRKELLRSNRELAQARDELSRNKQLVQQWHSRYLEANARLKETHGALAKLQGEDESAEPSRSSQLAGSSDYLAASLVAANEKLATESKLRQELVASLAEANDKLAAESKMRQELAAALAQANDELATESKMRRELETKLSKSLQAEAKRAEELQARKCAAATESSKTNCEKLVSEVGRLRGLLTAERSLRAAAEVQAKKSTVDQETLTRQLQRTNGELQAQQARAVAAANAAATAASKIGQLSEAEDRLEKLQARSRILSVENKALRVNAGNHRQRIAEMAEGQAMAAEEVRGRKLEAMAAAQEASKRGALVEETRRARKLEMDTIIKKMNSLSQSCRANDLQIVSKGAKTAAHRGSEVLRIARAGGC
eukprot:TRINITY_DN14234_c0_g1_i1.p1 TRINITY_DN14234_c0_g1~~TRINITY_DN14234_c0_g1_i1.p1  ORF type:complete len:399 (-),score=109.66 TRINITY_DN14234_c0_g1_i1:373-1527(-)